jgi:cysteine-rich repeat protein
MRRGNPLAACLVGLGLLACSPIVQSMLEKPRDGSSNDTRPDTPDVPQDGDAPPDVVPDGEDDPVELLPINIDSECAATRDVMGTGFRLDQCRDGAADTGEKCDDGNDENADGCDPYCLYETKVCDWAEPVGDPGDIAVEAGYAYVTDASLCVIIKINMGDGTSSVLAGSPGVCSWADGAAGDARFNAPRGVEIMGESLIVVDSGGNRIRRVDLGTGETFTLAGNGSEGILDDVCANAMFKGPTDIVSDGSSLYVADTGNGLVRAVRAPLDGTCWVERLAGNPLARPKGLAWMPLDLDHLYISDEGTHRIYRFTLSSTALEEIAGTGNPTYADNPVGTLASFDSPQGIDSNGIVLIVADAGNRLLREIRLEDPFPVTTMAGHELTSDCVDGRTRGSAARMRNPGCVVFEETGSSAFNKVFFCDEGCDAIRIVK